MFIITIPVYSFLAIPFLVALGGKEASGTIFSIGAIDFGLFLFVYCMGHIGYLALFSTWMAVMLILTVAVCDVFAAIVRNKIKPGHAVFFLRYIMTVPFTITISLLLSGWARLTIFHSVVLGMLIPLLVIIGNYTTDYFEADLGIEKEMLSPGRGQIFDNLKSLFYAAPIVFHYFKYFFI